MSTASATLGTPMIAGVLAVAALGWVAVALVVVVAVLLLTLRTVVLRRGGPRRWAP